MKALHILLLILMSCNKIHQKVYLVDKYCEKIDTNYNLSYSIKKTDFEPNYSMLSVIDGEISLEITKDSIYVWCIKRWDINCGKEFELITYIYDKKNKRTYKYNTSDYGNSDFIDSIKCIRYSDAKIFLIKENEHNRKIKEQELAIKKQYKKALKKLNKKSCN